MASRWYCRVLDQELGPITFQDMAEMIRAGTLTEDDPVRRELSEEWIPARDVIGLFRAAKGQAAQSPPSEPAERPQPATGSEASREAAVSSPKPAMASAPVVAPKPAASPKARRLRRLVLAASAGIVLAVVAVVVGRSILTFIPRGSEKEVAQSVLDAGGRVALIVGEKLVEVGPGGELPNGRFLVQNVHLPNYALIDDEVPDLTSLEELCDLSVSGSPVSDATLEHVGKMAELRALNLPATSVTDAGLQCLSGLTKLRWLNLSGTRVTDQGLQHLRALPKLNHLLLCGTRVGDGGLKQLAAMPNLLSVDLCGTRLTAAGVLSLRNALPKCQVAVDPHIEAAVREERKRQNAGPDQIAAEWVLQCGGTLDILLRGKKKPVRSPEELPKEAFAITDIYLGNKPMVNDDGLGCLAGLQRLQSLHLFVTRVTGRGMEHLRGMATLEVLNIAYTGVSDAGLERLKQLPKLRHVCLNQLPIGDTGLEHLRGHTGLQILGLQGTRITDKGLRIMQTLPNLHEVDLGGTKLSPQAVAALKTACPKCRVLGSETRQ